MALDLRGHPSSQHSPLGHLGPGRLGDPVPGLQGVCGLIVVEDAAVDGAAFEVHFVLGEGASLIGEHELNLS